LLPILGSAWAAALTFGDYAYHRSTDVTTLGTNLAKLFFAAGWLGGDTVLFFLSFFPSSHRPNCSEK